MGQTELILLLQPYVYYAGFGHDIIVTHIP